MSEAKEKDSFFDRASRTKARGKPLILIYKGMQIAFSKKRASLNDLLSIALLPQFASSC